MAASKPVIAVKPMALARPTRLRATLVRLVVFGRHAARVYANLLLPLVLGWQAASTSACIALDPDANLCAIGAAECSCTLGGFCDPGLSCIEDMCVDPSAVGSSGSGSETSATDPSASTGPTDPSDPATSSSDPTGPTTDGTDTMPIDGANYIFVTSSRHAAGAIGGLAGADAICQGRADAAGLDGSYVAWLSTQSGENAVARVGEGSGWIRPDGLPVANTVDQLRTGHFFYPPVLDENGTLAAPDIAWTGTYDGMFDAIEGNTDCAGWTSSDGAATSTAGDVGSVGSWWSSLYLLACASEYPLLCVGNDRQQEIVVEPIEGRRVFISEGYIVATQGRAAADSLCAQEASQSGFDGTFLAMLAVDGESPMARFDVDGPPWVRVDGVRVFADDGPLGDALLAPFMLDRNGTLLYLAMAWAGAGAADAAGAPATTCTNWTAMTGRATMFATLSTYWQGWGLGGAESECAQAGYPVVCMQE